jgi:hypothetical protein
MSAASFEASNDPIPSSPRYPRMMIYKSVLQCKIYERALYIVRTQSTHVVAYHILRSVIPFRINTHRTMCVIDRD